MSADVFDTPDQDKVDFLNPPESAPEGAQDFSMKTQRDKFLGGGSSRPKKQERNSRRLKVFEISRLVIEKPKLEGVENIPPNPCIIATTHLSDIDVQEVAMAVANIRKIGIVSQETNLTDPKFVPFVKAIGKENFFQIANAPYNKKGRTAYSLRFEDLEKMQQGITQEGRTMIVAGHNPTHDWQLAENPGMAAVILAHMANAPLVPAVVDIDSKKPVAQSTDFKSYLTLFNRPSAKVIFGEPMNLAEISEDKLRDAVGLYSPDQRRSMTPEQVAEARETLGILQRESEQMMEAFASNLPREKRGKWDKTAV